MYYYRAYNQSYLSDADWYYIDVPALPQASIIINDDEISADDTVTATHFKYYIYGQSEGQVLDLGPISIKNYDLAAKRFFIRLFPNESKFVTVAGGKIVRYTIFIGDIVHI